MGTDRLTDAKANEQQSVAVEQRRLSPFALARVQALQAELVATEAHIRSEQLRLIAADTDADLTSETWVIDLQRGLLERHELVDVPAPAPVKKLPRTPRKPRTKATRPAPDGR